MKFDNMKSVYICNLFAQATKTQRNPAQATKLANFKDNVENEFVTRWEGGSGSLPSHIVGNQTIHGVLVAMHL